MYAFIQKCIDLLSISSNVVLLIELPDS